MFEFSVIATVALLKILEESRLLLLFADTLLDHPESLLLQMVVELQADQLGEEEAVGSGLGKHMKVDFDKVFLHLELCRSHNMCDLVSQ